MVKKINQKGFTIIELLVVVAIIAVLAAIVLVNVTAYINQGKNAAIKGNLATVLTNGAVFYDTNGNYNTSGIRYYTVAKATPTLTFLANAGTNNLSLIYPQQINISA